MARNTMTLPQQIRKASSDLAELEDVRGRAAHIGADWLVQKLDRRISRKRAALAKLQAVQARIDALLSH